MSGADEAPESTTGTPAPETQGGPENTETALTPRPDYAPSTYVEGEDIEGEVSRKDIKFPRLNLVQKVGELSDSAKPGSLVLAKEVVLREPGQMLDVIAVKAQKLYQEQLPYGCGVTPRIFKTAEEVREAGLSLEWGASARAAEILNILFWIPQPEGVDAPHLFSVEGPEGLGSLVGFTAARTSYGTVGKALLGASKTFLTAEKGGLRATHWDLYSTLEKRENNSWHLARIRPTKRTSPELHAFLTEAIAALG